MPIRFTSLTVLTLVGLWSSALLAQTRATTGNTATGTTGTTGNTGSTATNAANAATQATSGQTGQGTGGNGGGQLQTAAPVGNEPTFNAGDGTLGSQVGQGFTGRQNQGFVGNRNAAQGGNTGMLNSQFNQFGNQDQNPNGNNSNSRTNIKRARPQQRIAFTYPKASLAQTQVVLTDRIGRLAGINGIGTQVSDQGVVTLTGTVASVDSKKLAEALTRLEPGVRSVKNELTVIPTP